jgi:hypothetical protein
MKSPSLEKFIFEHYYGYTKIDEDNTENINCNIRAGVNQVLEYKIDCDFKAMYGDAFAVLNDIEPAVL